MSPDQNSNKPTLENLQAKINACEAQINEIKDELDFHSTFNFKIIELEDKMNQIISVINKLEKRINRPF